MNTKKKKTCGEQLENKPPMEFDEWRVSRNLPPIHAQIGIGNSLSLKREFYEYEEYLEKYALQSKLKNS